MTFLFLVLLFSFGFLPNAISGGSNGGGGNVCTINGKAVLLELADFDPVFTSEPGSKGPLSYDLTMQLIGVSPFFNIADEFDKLPEVRLRIDAILAANKSTSPILVELLQYITKNLLFSFTSISIEVPVQAVFSNQKKCTYENTRATILFFPPMAGIIDLKQFQLLDLNSQAGLVIHEGIRVIQNLLYDGLQDENLFRKLLDDSRVQELTRRMFVIYFGLGNNKHVSLEFENIIDGFAQTRFLDIKRSSKRYSNNDRLRIKDSLILLLGKTRGQIDFLKKVLDDQVAQGDKLMYWLSDNNFGRLNEDQKSQINGVLRQRCNLKENLRPLIKNGNLIEYLNSSTRFQENAYRDNHTCHGDLRLNLIQQIKNSL